MSSLESSLYRSFPHDITLEIQSVFQNERNFVVFEEM